MQHSSAEFDHLLAAVEAHYDAGGVEQARLACREALVLRPGHPRALHNLGVITARLGHPASAIEWFDAALAAEPRYASAHYHRALALDSLGRQAAACEAFARTIACEPEHYAAHRALAFSLLARGRRGRALDHFARTYELRRGDDRSAIALKSLSSASRTKLRHDAEQFRYLAEVGTDPQHFEALANRYAAVAGNRSAQTAPLSDTDSELLGDSYNTAIYLAEAPEIRTGALAPRADGHILMEMPQGGIGAAYFDDLLSPRAFASLRRHLLRSTIWHDFTHIEGFVAAYLEDGFASPLLLQIADELRGTFPELLGAHPLSQAWAFKAVEPGNAIDVHADDAAVSVNLWMTPNEANRAPGRGGLEVCLAPPPSDWTPTGYELDHARSVHFLEQNRQNCTIVPYLANRAVIFPSRLLHCSHAPDFAPGYENHRISVTLLFGRSGASGPPSHADAAGKGPAEEAP